MSRLIDADAMLKRNECSIYDTTDLKEMLDNEPTANQWIPCINRLPKDNINVQVQLNNRLVFQGFIESGNWNIGCNGLMCLPIECIDTLEDYDLKVIAWQHLPEPYKEADSK